MVSPANHLREVSIPSRPHVGTAVVSLTLRVTRGVHNLAAADLVSHGACSHKRARIKRALRIFGEAFATCSLKARLEDWLSLKPSIDVFGECFADHFRLRSFVIGRAKVR